MSAIDAMTARSGGRPAQQRRLARAGMLAAALVTIGLVAMTIAFVVVARRAAVDRAGREIVARADLVAGQFSRALAEADRTLGYVELLAAHQPLTDAALHPVLKQLTAELPQTDGMVLLDLNGDILAGSAVSPPRRANLGDRSYFHAARDDTAGALHVGVPVRSRISASWVLPLARGLRGPDGRVVAVLVASLDIDYFRRVLAETLPDGGRIQVLSQSGIVMLREPAEDEAIGRDVSGRPLFHAMAGRDRGLLRLTDDAGIERVIAFHRLGGFPLIVTTGVDTAVVLRDWRLTSAVLLGSALALGSLIVLLAWTLVRGVDRLIDQDAGLTDASTLLNATLAHMGQGVVVVDGTDNVVLSNRRLPALLGVAEALGSPGSSLDQLAAAAGLEAELFAGAAGAEVERRLDDGRWVALQVDAMPGGRLVTLVDDITGRKAIEAELRLLVTTDPLTRLANRRAFFDRAAREHAAIAAGGPAGAVALIDIDHFKRLNDTYGHLAGDRALRAVADRMRQALLPGSMLARVGGEEFAVLMPDCPLDRAEPAADHLRACVEALEIVVGDDLAPGGIICCTISVGVAALGPGGPDAALAAADRMLYQAKSGGRNRVLVDTAPAGPASP